MQLDPAELKAARDRLVRVQGQIGGLVKMIDEGRDCTDILHQISAASTALTRAGFSIIATGMAACSSDDAGQADRAKHVHAVLVGGDHGDARGEIELAFGFLAAVALDAVLDQQWADLLLKNLQPARQALGVIRGQRHLRHLFGGQGAQGDEEEQDETEHRGRGT